MILNRKHALGLAICVGIFTLPLHSAAETKVGNDLSSAAGQNTDINGLLSANRGTNGGGDQSLQFGDIVSGTDEDDILVGALGVDILIGGNGDDVLIGGTEDFNPLNRDRGFGDDGDDVFIWAPGDGNDFFDGGTGTDVLILGVLGEERNADGSSEGAPFFNVNPPNTEGSQDFDGIFIDTAVTGLPAVEVANGPGFCNVIDGYNADASVDSEVLDELRALNLDQLIQFTLRGPANAFDAAISADPTIDPNTLDTGLRIAMHLRNTEFLVCGSRDGGSIVTLDLTTTPPTAVNSSVLPARAYSLIRPL